MADQLEAAGEKAEEGTRREITNSSANADAAAAFEENFHGALSVWRQRKPPDKNRRSRGIKGRDRLRERGRVEVDGAGKEGRLSNAMFVLRYSCPL